MDNKQKFVDMEKKIQEQYDEKAKEETAAVQEAPKPLTLPQMSQEQIAAAIAALQMLQQTTQEH